MSSLWSAESQDAKHPAMQETLPRVAYCPSFGTPGLTLALRDTLRWEEQSFPQPFETSLDTHTVDAPLGTQALLRQWTLKDYEGNVLALAWVPLWCFYQLEAFLGKGGLYLVVENPRTQLRYVLLPGSSLRIGERHARSLVQDPSSQVLCTAVSNPLPKPMPCMTPFLEVTLLEAASGIQKTPLSFDSWLFNAIESHTKTQELLLHPPHSAKRHEAHPVVCMQTQSKSTPIPIKQAMILGAGIGSRTLPLTDTTMGIAKPALPFGEGNTVIGHLLDQAADLGVETLFVNTCQHAASVQRILAEKQAHYAHLGLRTQIVTIPEEAPTGTAGALKTLLHHPEEYPSFDPNAPLLVLQGDTVTNVDLRTFVQGMSQAYAKYPTLSVGIGCKEVPDAWVTQFGIMAVTPHPDLTQQTSIQQIVAFKEKPSLQEAGTDRLASTGIYFLTPRVYALLSQLNTHKQRSSLGFEDEKETSNVCSSKIVPPILDFAKDVFPAFLSSEHLMLAMPLEGYWFDVGTPQQYYHVLAHLLRGLLPMPFSYHQGGHTDTKAACHFVTGADSLLAWPYTQHLLQEDTPQVAGAVLAILPHEDASSHTPSQDSLAMPSPLTANLTLKPSRTPKTRLSQATQPPLRESIALETYPEQPAYQRRILQRASNVSPASLTSSTTKPFMVKMRPEEKP
jgi:NDP-sugar pyrophosphorylase family protein